MSTEDSVVIRQMVVEDLNKVIAIDNAIRKTGKIITYADITAEQIVTALESFSKAAYPESYGEFLSRDITGNIQCCFVAEHESDIIGFIVGKIIDESDEGEKAGEILVVGVHPDYWNKGIGLRLLEKLRDAASHEGVKSISISVDKKDSYLRRWCENIGFTGKEIVKYTISI